LQAEPIQSGESGTATPLGQGLAPTLLFGFGAHVIIAVIGILVVPIYLHLLGPEGYGLFGFYVVLQSWMVIFDLGVSPAVGRQLSRFKAGALTAGEAGGLLKAAEAMFLAGGIAAAAIFVLSSDWLAANWLGASSLAPREIHRALQLIGCLIAGRWMAGLYQTALVGLERQISANMVALSGALARAVISTAALVFVASTPVTFFIVQATLTLAEAIACRLILARAMPRTAAGGQRPHWNLLAREFRFAGALALSAAIATMISQADKLALSHVLSLAEFGKFSLIVSICAGIALVVPPFAQAFQPRLTALLAQARRAEFAELYRLSLVLIIAVVAGLAGTIAVQPELTVYAWTGDRALAEHLAPALSAYALGAGVSAFLFAPFFLQYALGSVRLHLIGNALFGAVWIPALWLAATRFGALGAGLTWLGGNLLFVVAWIPVVHRRWLSAEERAGLAWGAWGRVALLTAPLAATRLIDPHAVDRIGALAILGVVSLTVMAIGVLSSRPLRDQARQWLGQGRPAP
jgi:O-antigen/teichoic acid export membrane protein